MRRMTMIGCVLVLFQLVGNVPVAGGREAAPSTSQTVGRSIGDFVAPDGRIDLDAVRSSRYRGPLDLKGVDVRPDLRAGEPIMRPSLSKAGGGDPDDIYWDNSIATVNGGLNGAVRAMAEYDGRLIVAGEFTTASGAPANHIAAWDGSSWSALGSGTDGSIACLTIIDNKLIVGGSFSTAGGVDVSGLAFWDGSSWSAIGTGREERVTALTVYENRLIAAGEFSIAGEVGGTNIAAWDGYSWSALGAVNFDQFECGYRVITLSIYDSKLIAGGYFRGIGRDPYSAISSPGVAAWDGSSWTRLGSGLYTGIGVWIPECVGPAIDRALTVHDNKLIAGGFFRSSDHDAANANIAAWNGASWSPLGLGGGEYQVVALSVYDDKLIAGGGFATAGGVNANGIASWDGSSWRPLGSGVNGSVSSLSVYDNKLAVGGGFTTAGDKVAAYIALWTKHDPYSGPVWHVAINGNDTTGDGSEEHPFATIQHGIDAAAAGDTVLVAAGTYCGEGNQEISFNGKDIVLVSKEGAEQTVVRCEGGLCGPFWDCPQIRAFVFSHGETQSAVLDGFTITGARPWRKAGWPTRRLGGGAIICSGGSPTIRNCIITGNEGTAGGAIVCDGSPARIEHNKIVGNSVGSWCDGGWSGGGIYCANSNAIIADNTISANSAPEGGAVCVWGASPTIVRNLMTNNTSVWGAAISCYSCSPVFEANTLANNRATPVYDCPEGSLFLLGTGRWHPNSLGDQSVVFIREAEIVMDSCLIASNIGVAVYCDSVGSAIVRTCDITGNTEGDWTGCIADQAGTNGNMSADPLFCDTATGDYHLSAGSPCAPANNAGVLIGALEVACGSTGIEDDELTTPITFSLDQNYPNPFNPVTTIEYSVPTRTQVTIEVYNVLGQRVRTLVNEVKSAGSHRIEWNGDDDAGKSVATGVYLYRFQAGDVVQTRKMLLLK